jgi:hypothetical protein
VTAQRGASLTGATTATSAGGGPDDAPWDLGRFFFDVAGLAEVRLYSVTRLQGDTASRIEVLAPAASRKMEGAACRRKARHSFGVPIACLTTSIISWGRTGFIIS